MESSRGRTDIPSADHDQIDYSPKSKSLRRYAYKCGGISNSVGINVMNVTRNSYVGTLRVTTHYLDWIATLERFDIHRTSAVSPNDNMIVVDRLAM